MTNGGDTPSTGPIDGPVEPPPDQRPLLPRHRRRPAMFEIGGSIRTHSFILISACVFLSLLFVWWLLTSGTGMVKPLFLPPPDAVFNTLKDQVNNGELWADMRVSIYRILVGFAAASVLAIPIGVLIGTYRFWEASIEPLVDFVRYMPVVAFVPLTILWSGTSDLQKFEIIWIGTFFQQVLMIMDNTKRVPRDLVDFGRTLGMKDSGILGRIIIRSAAPGIWDSLRITLGWAWTWLVLAELVAATSGLGYRITTAQRFFDTELIIGYILVLGVLGLITDQVMKALGRRFFRYAESER
jgi:NitT/TauT family transport system permease protein